jgi:50S ribosomal protein L16 3-hydroxylase
VGPHKDNYDVFLVQGIGCREWRVAVEEDVVADERNVELSLLHAFIGDGKYVSSKTDVLYLPPGVPHWGIAKDRCMTYSIGMRAPELAEFIIAANRLYPGRLAGNAAKTKPRVFYEDTDLDVAESGPGLISSRSLARARRRFDAVRRFDDEEFANIFGSLVTDPKAWLEPERPDDSELSEIVKHLSTWPQLRMHGMARVAHSEVSGDFQLFVNGFSRKCPSATGVQIANLCARRGLNQAEITQWQGDRQLSDILEWLLRIGAFDADAG